MSCRSRTAALAQRRGVAPVIWVWSHAQRWFTFGRCTPFVAAFALAPGWPFYRSSPWLRGRRFRACSCPRARRPPSEVARMRPPITATTTWRWARRRGRWPRMHRRTSIRSSTAGCVSWPRMPSLSSRTSRLPPRLWSARARSSPLWRRPFRGCAATGHRRVLGDPRHRPDSPRRR
jgi:hypothetical protein